MSDPNTAINGGFDLPAQGAPATQRVDRSRRSAGRSPAHEVRCDCCGGPVDGFHREVVGEHPDLGWTQRVFCRACVAAEPDIGLVER
jgi:hypothetical protein